MENNQGFAMGRGGYVRAVFSRRLRGHVVPLDLLRVVASVANRAGVRRRVASAFKGYLVTDAGPGVVPMFSARRAAHGVRLDRAFITGGNAEIWPLLGGALDAPEFIAAGCCINMNPFIADGKSAGAGSLRWSESLRGAVDCEAVPVWREDGGRVVVLGRVRTGRAAVGDDEVLRAEFAGELSGAAIDAPDFCLSGSMVGYESGAGKRCAVVDRFVRRGVF